MKIFIRNIPENTNPNDLVRFFTPFLKRSFKHPFRANGKIIKRYIVAQIDQEDDVVGRHGLVTIEPDEVAKSILKRIRRTPFKGKRVIIREFIDRSWQNDRRSLQPQHKITPINQRKRFERRLNKLEDATNVQISFLGQSQFSRKYF